MDLVNFVQQEKRVGLLSLPNSDCFLGASATSKPTTNQENNEVPAQAPKHTGQLVLMQLPKGVSISDIASGGCHFLAPKASGANSNSTTSNNSHIRQAALVVASKKQTFSVSRLETSNSLVLVPPLDNTGKDDAKENNINNQTTEDGPVSKKPKVVSSLVPVPARLLTPGGSGASFLELRPKLLRPGDLAEILQKHVFDLYNTTKVVNPYSNATGTKTSSTKETKIVGRTVPSLARELQSSPGQVEEALAFLQSFPMPLSKNNDKNDDKIYFGVLSEEALQEAQNAIIATLAESDDFGDYAGQGVPVDEFVAQALERLPGVEEHPKGGEHVIRYALTLFLPKAEKTAAKTSSNAYDPIGNLTGTLPLDVTKIAKCLAHRLFRSQKKPWEESRFCSRWQGELPGVGKQYQISLEMLRGVAIPVVPSSTPRKSSSSNSPGNNKREPLWRYLPADKLPFHPEERLHAVFAVREQWSLEDLAPYLESLVIETGLTQAELMLQYTTSTHSTTVGSDGKTFKLYSLKR